MTTQLPATNPDPARTILVLNGPNLNTLGAREPHIYGHETLTDVENNCAQLAADLGYTVEFFQSNDEGSMISFIHSKYRQCAGVIANFGAWTHTSIALRDAVTLLEVPLIEVHISNVHARETFRHHSYFSDIASGVIIGCGTSGYNFAMQRLAQLLNTQAELER